MRKYGPSVPGGVRESREHVLVYRQVLRLNFDSFERNPRPSQRILFLNDVGLVVNTFERLTKFGNGCFQLGEFARKIRSFEFPLFPRDVALARIVKIQVHPCYPVFVKINSVHAAHEHKAGTPFGTEPLLEWFPIRLHSLSSPLLLWHLLCSVLHARLLIQFAQFSLELH